MKVRLSVVLLAMTLVGCQNYTLAPLCTSDNIVDPFELPGFEGTYQYTVQNKDFSTETHVIDLKRGGDLSVLTDDAEATVCVLGGKVFIQSEDSYELGYYQYDQLEISDWGLEIRAVFFDREEAALVGVRSMVFELPEGLEAALSHLGLDRWGSVFDSLSEKTGLLLLNAGVDTKRVLFAAKASPMSLGIRRVD